MLIDTHAHIHFDEYRDELDAVLERAHAVGVDKLLCVGVDEQDSGQAVAVARAYDNVWATVGLHPHEADRGYEALEEVARLAELDKVVGIGECGLDYYKSETSREDQERALRFQLELGLERDLAMVFHVRDAFDDFFRIIDEYENVRGVVHCFTAGTEEMRQVVKRGLYIALNGIMTFSKDARQLAAAREVPLDHLVLETDCPFLTPVPHRGQRNEPAYTALTAKFLAELRGEPLEDVAAATTRNAEALFRI
ncbi:MAG TPA: TatD family hydrolase [Candidatus Saccharimonadia bacterium]|nr:TatD family hydrolase [Candidatus Saccharimonadia bacterium]